MRRLSVLLLLLPTIAHAGDPEQAVVRLRERLDDFRAVGDGPGESFVAGWRHDDAGVMKWADATIGHGWYLGQLATARAVAVREGRDLAAIDAELADALAAVERVDRVAETGFPEPCTSSEALNGFFVRDDVPADFGARFDGITAVQSDWSDPSTALKEMSQDQVHHLLLGLALVKRFVPADAEVDGRALAPWAVELATRILRWVEHDDWVIRNPACGDREVARGGNAQFVAGGFAAVFRWLTDGVEDLPSAAAYQASWETYRVPPPNNPFYLNPDNLHMASVTAAVGKGFGDDTLPVLVELAERDDWVAYPLIHVALHGDVPGWAEHREDLLARARTQLEELPDDDEPRGYPEGEAVVHGWTSWHRYIRPAEQHYVGAAGKVGQRYSGIDWLLLHDLVALAPEVGVADTDVPATDEPGCGCTTGGGARGGLVLLLPALAWLGRRRSTRAVRPSSPGSSR